MATREFEVYVPVRVDFKDGKPVSFVVDHEGAPWMYSANGTECKWTPEAEQWTDPTEDELNAACDMVHNATLLETLKPPTGGKS